MYHIRYSYKGCSKQNLITILQTMASVQFWFEITEFKSDALSIKILI
jgi:hypothetical protein